MQIGSVKFVETLQHGKSYSDAVARYWYSYQWVWEKNTRFAAGPPQKSVYIMLKMRRIKWTKIRHSKFLVPRVRYKLNSAGVPAIKAMPLLYLHCKPKIWICPTLQRFYCPYMLERHKFSENCEIVFMYRRPILCTLHVAVDFLKFLKIAVVWGWGATGT
jgi:hypothetical protein